MNISFRNRLLRSLLDLKDCVHCDSGFLDWLQNDNWLSIVVKSFGSVLQFLDCVAAASSSRAVAYLCKRLVFFCWCSIHWYIKICSVLLGVFFMIPWFFIMKAAKGQESLEEEYLAKVKAEVREELRQTLTGDEVKS